MLSFKNEEDKIYCGKYHTPTVAIKDFNVLIDGKSFFNVPIKNKEKTCGKIIEISRNNDYTTGNLLNYKYFSKHYKLIAIDLSKQTELENPDLKEQINFIVKHEEDKTTMFFIIEKTEKKATFNFSQNFVSII